jgi:hypothetical protein
MKHNACIRRCCRAGRPGAAGEEIGTAAQVPRQRPAVATRGVRPPMRCRRSAASRAGLETRTTRVPDWAWRRLSACRVTVQSDASVNRKQAPSPNCTIPAAAGSADSGSLTDSTTVFRSLSFIRASSERHLRGDLADFRWGASRPLRCAQFRRGLWCPAATSASRRRGRGGPGSPHLVDTRVRSATRAFRSGCPPPPSRAWDRGRFPRLRGPVPRSPGTSDQARPLSRARFSSGCKASRATWLANRSIVALASKVRPTASL